MLGVGLLVLVESAPPLPPGSMGVKLSLRPGLCMSSLDYVWAFVH
jgi:hypothetical protein